MPSEDSDYKFIPIFPDEVAEKIHGLYHGAVEDARTDSGARIEALKEGVLSALGECTTTLTHSMMEDPRSTAIFLLYLGVKLRDAIPDIVPLLDASIIDPRFSEFFDVYKKRVARREADRKREAAQPPNEKIPPQRAIHSHKSFAKDNHE